MTTTAYREILPAIYASLHRLSQHPIMPIFTHHHAAVLLVANFHLECPIVTLEANTAGEGISPKTACPREGDEVRATIRHRNRGTADYSPFHPAGMVRTVQLPLSILPSRYTQLCLQQLPVELVTLKIKLHIPPSPHCPLFRFDDADKELWDLT